MWEGFDEPFHYAYVQYIAEYGRLPPLNGPAVSIEILRSLQLFPTTSHLSRLSPMRFEDFWVLSAVDRTRLRQSVETIDPATRHELSELPNRQTQHPPLYYVLCAPVYLAARHLPIVERVFVLRAFSLLIAAFSLPLGYLLARRVFKSKWAVLVPVLMALFPNYYVFIGRITNDALAVIVFPLLIVASGKLLENSTGVGKPVLVGALLGVGLLTKTYFLTALPVLLVAVLLKRFRAEISSTAAGLACLGILVPATTVAGWWYVRNYIDLRSFSGLTQTRMTSSLPSAAWIKGLLHLRLGEFATAVFRLHLWAGNWSFRMVSNTPYRVFEVAYALCGLGILRWLLINRPILSPEPEQYLNKRHQLMILTGFLLSFLAGMLYHRWSATVAGMFIDRAWFGGIGSEGWYINVLLPIEAILLILGIRGLVGRKLERVASLAMLGLFFLLDQVALWSREIPYYAGLSIRVADPLTHLWGAAQEVTAKLGLAFDRVAFLGPHPVTKTILLALIGVMLCCVGACFLFAYRSLSENLADASGTGEASAAGSGAALPRT